MGPLPKPETPIALGVEPLETVTLEGTPPLLRRKIRYHTDSPDEWIAAYLLLPQGAESKRPAILCLHQTTDIGKGEPAGLGGNPHLHYALELAQRGFVTLAPDYPSFGDSKYAFPPDRGYASGSMKAIYDNIRAIDLLLSLNEVDGERIGCIGHSLGGHNTLFTAVFEPRIKALATSCGFTRFHKYYGGKLAGWTSDRYMPRIRNEFHNNPDEMPFDFTEIVGSLAPRPFLAVAPLHDGNFEVSGVRDVMAAAKPVYELYEAAERLQADYPDCEHDFPDESRERAYRFLEAALRK
jgi:dienelactone hydrolase